MLYPLRKNENKSNTLIKGGCTPRMQRPRFFYGCYAFIALIILLLGLFYLSTLTEHLSRNPLSNSRVKLIKMDSGVDFQTVFCTSVESWSSGALHTISRAADRGQENEFSLIFILLIYLFAYL